MSSPLTTLFAYRGIGIRVETRPPDRPNSPGEYSISAFGRVLETRQIAASRLTAEDSLDRLHRTVIAAVRAGRFDALLEARAREVFGGGQHRPAAGDPRTPTGPAAPPSAEIERSPATLEPLGVEILGDLPAAPGTRLELVLRAVLRGSGTPVADARVHAQLLAEGGRVRASLSGATDASGQMRLRVQLPAQPPSSLAVRVEYGGATILLRQELTGS